MKKIACVLILLISGFFFSAAVFAADPAENSNEAGSSQSADSGTTKNPDSAKPGRIDEVMVKGKKEATPLSKSFDVEKQKTAGNPQNVMDLLKNESVLDFRGESDLVSNDDPFFLRGFSGDRFATAIDGLTIRKTGGRKGSNIVDYMLLPPWLVERIEVIPGPHSALYPGKSMGGVVNLVTKKPTKHESLRPDMNMSAGYQSYNTQSYNADMRGSLSLFTYDGGVQKYSTDGYLRNDAADLQTFFGRAGIIIPDTGFVAVSGSYSGADREIPVNNNSKLSDYDSSRPNVTGSEFAPWQNPTWDKKAYAYRINSLFETPVGSIKATGYLSKENRDRAYTDYKNKKNPSLGTVYTSSVTNWWQRAFKVEDALAFSDKHTTTIEADIEQLFDNGGYQGKNHKDKRVEEKGGALQHQWQVTDSLRLIGGLRYEDVSIRVTNYNATTKTYSITGRDKWIERNWSSCSPKSMVNYDFDSIASFLRDTSIAGGVSRIWHAPDSHGLYNPQGKPTGAWLEPEKGIAYDVMLKRRIAGDVHFQCGYSFYSIKNFIVSNSKAKYTPSSTNTVSPGLEYSDYDINLYKVYRHGIDLDLRGELFEGFDFNCSYSFQTFDSRGNEPAGQDAVDKLPKHRLGAGVNWTLPTKTTLSADYRYESEQIDTISDEISKDVYSYRENKRKGYQTVDLSLTQIMVSDRFFMKNSSVKIYVTNLFNEKYENADGYPMTERTFGGLVSIKL